MKTALLLSLALVALLPARGQILRPEAVNGAVLGGIAGAIIGRHGGDSRHDAWRGAAIGAGAGLVLGEIVGQANARRGDYVYRERPTVHVGIDYGFRGGPWNRGFGYGYYPSHRRFAHPRDVTPGLGWGYSVFGSFPVYGYYPGYGEGYPYYDGFGAGRSGSAASAGLLLGALAGGIIGHNSGDFRHNGWRGAAWGAGAGWLLGSIVDARRPVVGSAAAPVITPPAAPAVQAPAAPPQQAAIINPPYQSPSSMSAANGLFGR